MSGIEDRLAAMQRHGLDKKREAWECIKQNDADLADFLTRFNAVFGKPRYIQVMIGERIVIDQGDLLPAKRSRFDPPWMR